MSAIPATIGLNNEIRAILLKTAQPLFDKAGKLALDCFSKFTTMIVDSLEHHHKVSVKECSGVDIIIDEVATDVIGHRIRLTVLWSPEDKMNDKSFEHSGRSAVEGRERAQACIDALAKYYYKKPEGKQQEKC